MIDLNTALVALTAASLTYGAATLAAPRIARAIAAVTMRKVGGIRFLRIGRAQFSFCMCRPAPVISAARMAAATKRAQSTEARRLDAIASRWANG